MVSIANKYSETPIDKAKMPLREILKGRRLPPARRPCLWLLLVLESPFRWEEAKHFFQMGLKQCSSKQGKFHRADLH